MSVSNQNVTPVEYTIFSCGIYYPYFIYISIILIPVSLYSFFDFEKILKKTLKKYTMCTHIPLT